MAKINRYKPKLDGYMPKKARSGGLWIRKDADHFIGQSFKVKDGRAVLEFSINVAFVNGSMDEWNDFDSVLIIDDDFGQPYTPFYGKNWGEEITDFPILEQVIEKYNEFMDKQPYLEKELMSC